MNYNCLFCSKLCKTRAVFSERAISQKLNEKLVQFIICLLNGVKNLDINFHPAPKQWSLTDACPLVSGYNCAEFVGFCLDAILSYKIEPLKILMGKVFEHDRRRNNSFYWIRNRCELMTLNRGDILYTIHENYLNEHHKTTWNLHRDMMNTDANSLNLFFSNERRGQNVVFAHVFFYLGNLYPTNYIYVGGLNHPYPHKQYGIFTQTNLFSFNNDGTICFYKDTGNFYLIAQRIF